MTRGALTSFIDLRYRVHDLVPGGAPPEVEQRSDLPKHASSGALVVIGDCDALYFRQGSDWRVLERTPRGGSFPLRLRLPAEPTTQPLPLVVVDGAAPAVVTAEVLPGNRVVLALNGIYRSDPVHFDPRRDHDVDVVLDPALQHMSFAFDGREVKSMDTPNQYYADRLPPLDHVSIGRNATHLGVAPEYGGALRVRPTSTSLCRRLVGGG